MSSVSLDTVGNLLQLKRRTLSIEPEAPYTLIGVYSFGNGIFHREPIPGSELGDYRFSVVRSGDLVLSNIQAWEGAIATARDSDDGCIATHRFLTYIPIDHERVDVDYLRYFFLSDPGIALIRKASPGSVLRNRTLGIKAFESIEVPLPSVSRQRQISSRLKSIVRSASHGLRLIEHSMRRRAALVDSLVQRCIDTGLSEGWDLLPLREIAEINPTPKRLDPDTDVTFVPMAAVDDKRGRISIQERRKLVELKGGYKQFCSGDVIFARITPCMQNGKVAVASGLQTEYGYGSTEFHVIRTDNNVTAEWLHRLFRTARFKAEAAKHFTGTAGHQRVPASFLRNVVIPVPPMDVRKQVIAEIDRMTATGEEIAARQSLQRGKLSALQAATLNDVFSGLI